MTTQELKSQYEATELNTLIALKKNLYADVDIELPMTIVEKLLNEVIADKFSEVNQRIIEKRNLSRI